MTSRTAYAALWLVLALATLVLVVQEGQALPAALTAWLGGIVTCRLWDLYRHP